MSEERSPRTLPSVKRSPESVVITCPGCGALTELTVRLPEVSYRYRGECCEAAIRRFIESVSERLTEDSFPSAMPTEGERHE